MSPRTADPALRTALLEEAARLIAEEGGQALTLRRLTRGIGVSTMAVYTHFGSMDELRSAIREEGFARLARRMDAVETTSDPVADLMVLGWAYFDHATTDPNLYRAMFMEECRAGDEHIGGDTFLRLAAAVERCVHSGRFRGSDPIGLARQLWVVDHGVVTLLLSGHLSDAEARACLVDMAGNLVAAFGDDPAARQRSLDRAAARLRAEGT